MLIDNMLLISLISFLCLTNGFNFNNQKFAMKSTLQMSDQVLAAQPTIEDWLGVVEPGLKKATMGMFRACKEIAYKIRTASCDKMACFNEFGKLNIFISIIIS